jgi:hypothetical protein
MAVRHQPRGHPGHVGDGNRRVLPRFGWWPNHPSGFHPPGVSWRWRSTEYRPRGRPQTPAAARLRRPGTGESRAEHRVLDRLNGRLAQFERVKRFALLPTEFTMERGELTATMKVRRQVVEQRWRPLIETIHSS